ncbi:MAG: hypothetical protein Q7R34_06315, partial [Dehalococcoidia bacterium]|nr:hypothetical protein [Dehalococcoidia bacterium]
MIDKKQAITIGCDYCNAQPGKRCHEFGRPDSPTPLHDNRVNQYRHQESTRIVNLYPEMLEAFKTIIGNLVQANGEITEPEQPVPFVPYNVAICQKIAREIIAKCEIGGEMINTANPEASALNQVRREAEEAGVLEDYLNTVGSWVIEGRLPSI